ncbi:hypothetical protein A2740_02230 [Candidatus Nomurabacteria bacterium RIFCSPHIGHO2_01_FULL_43_16]|nr:MAG: hypothetical protein A2740_02230 [Candidatus Nomurabacteria bacterium RIFCSPHIGHO2_01_FULL_43_16]
MRKSKIIYLDYAASVSPNPSSIHVLGVEAQKKLKNARREVAGVLKARPEEIIFTSGGTESNNLAIQGLIHLFPAPLLVKERGKEVRFLPHIITTNIEHPSVLETCRMLEKRKLAQVSIVPVEKNGIVDPEKIKKEIKNNTVLVSVMYANNEIGTIQPIKEIAKEIKHYRKTGKNGILEHGYFSAEKFLVLAPPRSQVSKTLLLPLFHTDAVQAANYLDLNVEKLGVDMLTLSGSKIEGAGRRLAGANFGHAQAGRVGVLYKKKSVSLSPVFGGGDQEMGLRPGTENLPEIVKFAEALKHTDRIKEKETKRLMKLRDYFRRVLDTRQSGVQHPTGLIINGDFKNRLPNNVNITFPNIPSDLLVIELSAKGIMVSSKSACKSSRAGGSYVIKAIRDNKGLPAEALAEEGGVRFSLGRATTKKDIDYTIKSLSHILTKLKKWYTPTPI